MVIKIPSLKEKSLQEREQMVLYLYALEAAVICSDIIIDKDTMAALILYHPKGNIGQLKNDIKLSIARSYLEMHNNKESELRIRKYTLSHQASDGLIDQDIKQRKEIEKVLIQDTYTVTPFSAEPAVMPASMFEFPVFDTTKSDIQTSFEEYVDKIAASLEQDSPPSFIIDNEIREIMTFIHEWILQNMQILIERRQSAALAFYLKNIRDYQTDAYLHDEYAWECEIEYIEKARSLIRSIEQRFNLRITSEEVHTLACILKTFKSNSLELCSISMFVVAHGNSLATNIADVVNELLSIDYVIAQDMPLTKNVNQIIEELIEKICKEPVHNDIVLFVDMGSLMSLEETLLQRCSYNIVVVPTVHTLLVLDAARKAMFMQYPLSNILHDVMRMNQKVDQTLEHHIRSHIGQYNEKIIYTICYSGDGTAHYLEKYLKDMMEQAGIFNIEILALSNDSLIKIRSIIEETSKHKEVLCMIGNVDPGVHEYPFISIEDILLSDGVKRLFNTIGSIEFVNNQDVIKRFERNVFVDVAFESIDKYLMYLNSKKLSHLIMDFVKGLENDLECTLTNRTLTRLIVHMACMVERLLFHEYSFEQNAGTSEYLKTQKRLYAAVSENLQGIASACSITVNQEECYYIIQILKEDDTLAEHIVFS